MHLGRSRLAQHADQGALGVAAHDGVIDDDQPRAGDHVSQRIQLQPDAQLADRLARLDEGPADVGVLDQPLPVRDAGSFGISNCRRRTRLGHRNHQIGIGRALARECPPHLNPNGVQPATGDHGVRPGQIHVLKQAALGVGLGEGTTAQAIGVYGDHLAWRDFPDECGPHNVQRGGLTRDDPAAFQPAKHQRPDALRIPRGVQGLFVHENQAERAAQPGQHLKRRLLGVQAVEGGHKRRDQRSVAGGVGHRSGKQGAGMLITFLQPALQLQRVGQIAVVRERKASGRG